MNPHPQPTDRPGIFRCPVCGLQNPRPIKRPFQHQCGKAEPLEPYDADTLAFINRIVCPSCEHYRPATRRCQCGKCAKGVPIERLTRCPAYQW